MPIIFKGNVETKPKEVKEGPKPLSFQELKARAQPIETPVTQIVETKPRVVEKQESTNGNLIKPKYMEDKSVYYKSSGYLKDLLGEGN